MKKFTDEEIKDPLFQRVSLETGEVIQAVSALSEAGGAEAMSTATRLMEMGKIR